MYDDKGEYFHWQQVLLKSECEYQYPSSFKYPMVFAPTALHQYRPEKALFTVLPYRMTGNTTHDMPHNKRLHSTIINCNILRLFCGPGNACLCYRKSPNSCPQNITTPPWKRSLIGCLLCVISIDREAPPDAHRYPLETYTPSFPVPFMYFNIRQAALQCVMLGIWQNFATALVALPILGLNSLANYIKPPTISRKWSPSLRPKIFELNTWRCWHFPPTRSTKFLRYFLGKIILQNRQHTVNPVLLKRRTSISCQLTMLVDDYLSIPSITKTIPPSLTSYS